MPTIRQGKIIDVKMTAFDSDLSSTSVYVNGLNIVKVAGSVTYNVVIDSPEQAPVAASGDPRLPRLGSTYSERGSELTGTTYLRLNASQTGRCGKYFLWKYKYSLGTVSNAAATTQEKDGTILTISASTEAEQVANACDLDGVWNVNSLGEWYQEPLNVNYGILTFTFVRREYENPWLKAMDFWETINDGQTWGVFPAASLKVASIIPTMTQTESQTYWDVNYQIKYRALGWLLKKANCGFYARSPLLPNPYRILNSDGSPVESPALLNVDGSLLPPGAAPIFQTFRLNRYADFNDLNLPSPFDFQ